MRNFLLGILLTAVTVLIYKQCTTVSVRDEINGSELIVKQLKNVSKLVVTEGHFSEVYNYEDSKEIFGDFITAEKKAIVVVNAQVTISYDLKQVKYKLDSTKQVLELTSIPDYEISISPDLEYYDIQSDFLNPFEAEDYNKIRETIKKSLLEKVERSSLKTNAQNRLVSELSNFFILSKSLGWKLVYKGEQVRSQNDFENLLL